METSSSMDIDDGSGQGMNRLRDLEQSLISCFFQETFAEYVGVKELQTDLCSILAFARAASSTSTRIVCSNGWNTRRKSFASCAITDFLSLRVSLGWLIFFVSFCFRDVLSFDIKLIGFVSAEFIWQNILFSVKIVHIATSMQDRSRFLSCYSKNSLISS